MTKSTVIVAIILSLVTYAEILVALSLHYVTMIRMSGVTSFLIGPALLSHLFPAFTDQNWCTGQGSSSPSPSSPTTTR